MLPARSRRPIFTAAAWSPPTQPAPRFPPCRSRTPSNASARHASSPLLHGPSTSACKRRKSSAETSFSVHWLRPTRTSPTKLRWSSNLVSKWQSSRVTSAPSRSPPRWTLPSPARCSLGTRLNSTALVFALARRVPSANLSQKFGRLRHGLKSGLSAELLALLEQPVLHRPCGDLRARSQPQAV